LTGACGAGLLRESDFDRGQSAGGGAVWLPMPLSRGAAHAKLLQNRAGKPYGATTSPLGPVEATGSDDNHFAVFSCEAVFCSARAVFYSASASESLFTGAKNSVLRGESDGAKAALKATSNEQSNACGQPAKVSPGSERKRGAAH
jgi:hypothetical protein